MCFIVLCFLQATEARSTSLHVPVAQVLPDVEQIPVSIGNDIRFRRLNASQGLSQTRVAQIVQDNDGFIWFGTQHGVNRYDGQSYRVFKNDPDDPGSLSGSFIFALFKARDGTIWVGSDQGLDAFDKRTEQFKHYALDGSSPVVLHINDDPEGILWLATSGGLFRLDPATGETRIFKSDPRDTQSLASSDIKSTGFDRQGTFWVVTSQGLDAFDRVSGKVSARIPLQDSVREYYFHEDSHGVFWIIHGSGNGLAVFDREKNQLRELSFYTDKRTGSLTGVYSILETHDGTVWLATMGAGLLKFDREANKFVAYQASAIDPDSIAENRVITLFEDIEGNVWTGLHATAPNFFPVTALPFSGFRPSTPYSNAFGETLVNAVFADSHGRIWIGGGGALTVIDRETRERRVIDPLGNGSPVEILSIQEASDGSFWIGTLGSGLIQLNGEGKFLRGFRHDTADPESLSSDIVGRLVFDPAGKLWATTWNGLVSYDDTTMRFKTYKYSPAADAEVYHYLSRQSNGVLWLGSSHGLYRFDPSTEKFERFTNSSADPSSLSNNSANSIYVDGDGAVWVGTQNGLNRYDPASRQFRRYYQKDGLGGGVVSCILADRSGDLWMSTNQGVSRFNKETSHFDNFTTADGLPGNDLTGWDTCHTSKSGEMFFGGFSGVASVNPEDLNRDTFVPPIVFTELRLRDRTIRAGEPPLDDGALGQIRGIVLSREQNDFSVSFAALSYRNPETTRYRYRLVGLDDTWHSIRGGDHSVDFFSLPRSAFRLEVQASTSRGPWSDPPVALNIEITPAWWETTLFRLLCVASVIGIIIGLYLFRLRQLAANYNIRLMERIAERNRIARELHDSLLQGLHGLIFSLQAVRNLFAAEPEKALAMFDKALDRGDQAISEGRRAVRDLRDVHAAETTLLRALNELADEIKNQSPRPVSITVSTDGYKRNVAPIVHHEIYFIAREAFRNAVAHSSCTRISCDLVFDRDQLRVIIRDNGHGLDLTVLHAGTREGHWGLPGMRERAESLGGKMSVNSNRELGTEIVATVPGKAAYA
ncbi:hypothetical protein HFO58_11015 [Rhizobium leguminosarum]|uniref:sensor histidine kinase n=1 Tax=Rhizobium leguminosarum TaxID=384 RepID=UPI001C982FA9|nr:sensor histidine kinase [Rhizobium leguminosarum]MBY5533687.1 hypothetical protein [Rhizobium leguminosarum]